MLNHKVAVYVPSTVNGNQPAPAELVAKWVKQAKIKLANLFGGFTAYEGHGGYYSPIHGLIEENVVIVQAHTDEEGLTKVPQVKALAKEIATDMQQEAVSVEVDGELAFVN